jgi:hypothetical protein
MQQGKGSPAGHGVETPVDEDSQLCVVAPLGKAMRVKRVDCSLVMRQRLARAKAAGNRPSTAHAAYRVVLRIMGSVINSPLHLLGNLSVAINVLGAPIADAQIIILRCQLRVLKRVPAAA